MTKSNSPTTDVVAINVVSPFISIASTHANVKSSAVVWISIKTVYDAVAISRHIEKIGFE